MATEKVYVVIVKDETEQSNRIIGVRGFSHFSGAFYNYPHGICRYAFIREYIKAAVYQDVKKKLGNAFQPNLNFVDLYSREWHRSDITSPVKS